MPPRVSENGLPSRIAAMVRGPQSLREDIADEIADHLACHEEDEPAADPAVAHAAAVRAFGNAEQVARELRAIHLGDLIMFQKITIAALVVIVAGMAATAYFSWLSSRRTAEQFAQMNEQLTTLVEIQREALPKKETPPGESPGVRLHIHHGIAPNDEPAAGWTVQVQTTNLPGRRSFTGSYATDANGWITTDPLPRSGRCWLVSKEADASDANTFAEHSTSFEVKAVQEDTIEKRFTVTYPEREIRIHWPDGFSWDRSAMGRGKVRFITEDDNTRVVTRVQPIDLFKPNRVKGLAPGKAKMWLCLPSVYRQLRFTPPSSPGELSKPEIPQPESIEEAWWEAGEVTVTASSEPLDIQVDFGPETMIAGVLYDGTRDRVLSDMVLQIVQPVQSASMPGSSACYHRQHVRTDAQGRFSTFAIRKWLLESVPRSAGDRGPGTPPTPMPPVPGPPGVGPRGSPSAQPPTLIGVPCLLVGGKDSQIVWFGAGDPIRLLTLADSSIFVEIDASCVGTAKVSLAGLEGLTAAGRSANGPARLRPLRHASRGWTEVIEWQRTLECDADATIDIPLPTGKYSLSAEMPVIERDPPQPDVERRCVYSRSMDVEIRRGEVTPVALPVGDLKDWKAGPPAWHRSSQPASQPATNPQGR